MAPTNNIWAQMGYVPPRGACNHKDSLLSPRCPCQRFMIHPLKVSTSFECDGCQHHASFHNMENQSDDAIVKRWQAAELEKQQDSNGENGARKRPRRAIEGANQMQMLSRERSATAEVQAGSSGTAPKTRTKKKGAKVSQAGSGNAGSRVIELSSDNDDVKVDEEGGNTDAGDPYSFWNS
ncbi:hypothetical protein EJ08DRAFT_603671 [Tothia fuscella]|uniref:Uncharacterized protein n=1 Tax=Tothia fuscella TaxID=1048955 RepID=A0A9P4P2Q3_9PEZI|nr:hypothetical protein EJ08DRAFT_603671 [Tothia fuscella]